MTIPSYGNQRLRSAIETALSCGSSDVATVVHLLKPETRAEHAAAPLVGSGTGFERALPALDMYDQLLGGTTTEVRQ